MSGAESKDPEDASSVDAASRRSPQAVSGELPEAAWRRKRCRDPSTRPHPAIAGLGLAQDGTVKRPVATLTVSGRVVRRPFSAAVPDQQKAQKKRNQRKFSKFDISIVSRRFAINCKPPKNTKHNTQYFSKPFHLLHSWAVGLVRVD
jgi:hypothetical protein